MQQAERKYTATEHGREMKRQKAARYRDNNPEKERARKAVSDAVRRAVLPRVSSVQCAHCEKQAQTYHHWSYLQEHHLDVVPLCRKCHTAEHKGEV